MLEEGSTDYTFQKLYPIIKYNQGVFYYKALLSYVGLNKTYIFDAPKRIYKAILG